MIFFPATCASEKIPFVTLVYGPCPCARRDGRGKLLNFAKFSNFPRTLPLPEKARQGFFGSFNYQSSPSDSIVAFQSPPLCGGKLKCPRPGSDGGISQKNEGETLGRSKHADWETSAEADWRRYFGGNIVAIWRNRFKYIILFRLRKSVNKFYTFCKQSSQNQDFMLFLSGKGRCFANLRQKVKVVRPSRLVTKILPRWLSRMVLTM